VKSRAEVVALTRDLTAQGVSALWATHILDEIRPEDGLVILHQGRVLAHGRPARSAAGDLTRRFLDLTGGAA
jgi:ABC-2 type transport system ATP-binding protein